MDALRACFVEPEGNVDKKRFQPASYLRKTFTIDKDVERADLYITACGMYKGFVNGTPVTSHVFMPGFTYYTKRLQYQVYDVTRLLVPGHNSICLILGDGWYRGKIGVSSRRHFYGDKTKISAVLDLSFTDGTRVPVATGGSWKATQDGPVRKSDWKDGEIYDARMELAGWHEPGYDDGSWHGVHPASYAGELVPSEGEPVLEHERFRPEVITTPDGATVLDFKQNLFGYVEFTVTGPWGHRVKLAHGETLDERGNFTLKNLTTEGTFFSRWKLLQEIDYTLKDGTQTYKPHFTCHGFRYVKVEHWPEPVKPENFASIAVYSDMAPAGSFECSDESINQLVRNTVWGLKSNFLDIPTDCPTRERAGWTGDISQFSLTASFLMDTRKFLAKWLKDVALQQHDDGRVASIVPDVGLPSFVDGAAGWADAAITVPHVLHAMYGDEGILRDQYACMTRWMDFLERRARKKHPARWLTRNPHRGSTIDAGFHWGEWLEPGHVMALDAIKGFLNPDFEVATACYGYSARLMAGIAAVLGKDGDAGKYRALHERVKAGYRYMYTGGGAVTSTRQCRYIRPVAYGLLPIEDEREAVRRLNELVIANGYKVGTGFLTTPHLLPVLSDHGYVETAYKVLENKERPGWLYEVLHGATTIWENWNGIDEQGRPKDSLNHYLMGCVCAWLFTHVAGITPLAPGFTRIKIKPLPGGSLTRVACEYKSVAGLVASSWTVRDGVFTLTIRVPSDTEVHMPDGEITRVPRGEHEFACNYSPGARDGHHVG